MNQPHHNLRSLSSALKSTGFSGEFRIHGPVLPTTYRSRERLAMVSGAGGTFLEAMVAAIFNYVYSS